MVAVVDSYLEAEIGDGGVRILRAVKAELDARGVLSPGVLIPGDQAT